MELTNLPPELVELVIIHVIPEGFESLALSCRAMYNLCRPFIERHNRLRSHFNEFSFEPEPDDPSFDIHTSFHLIERIANEPMVARYVQHADFMADSSTLRRQTLPEDVESDGAVARLLADSPYLQEAGLDWKEYLAEMARELRTGRYSQHACAFLLTLLPKADALKLPYWWKPVDSTNTLVDAIVRKAKQSAVSFEGPSLAKVTTFMPFVRKSRLPENNFAWAIPFLALPQLQYFWLTNSSLREDAHNSVAFRYSHHGVGEMLQCVDLVHCCFDEAEMADFLRHTPRLRRLRFSYIKNENGPDSWNMCKLIMAIAYEVGSHLEELYIQIGDRRGSIAPGKVSMQEFQRLRSLEYPLDVALCNLAFAERQLSTSDESVVRGTAESETNHDISFIEDLLPASVTQFSLITDGTKAHAQALYDIFHDFAAKQSQLSALTDIYLSCPSSGDPSYHSLCNILRAKTEKAGVALHSTRRTGSNFELMSPIT